MQACYAVLTMHRVHGEDGVMRLAHDALPGGLDWWRGCALPSCPLALGRISCATACMMRRLSCFAFGITEKRVPDSQYGSALRRRFNAPAGHAST